jgi:hypothetical protein
LFSKTLNLSSLEPVDEKNLQKRVLDRSARRHLHADAISEVKSDFIWVQVLGNHHWPSGETQTHLQNFRGLSLYLRRFKAVLSNASEMLLVF